MNWSMQKLVQDRTHTFCFLEVTRDWCALILVRLVINVP